MTEVRQQLHKLTECSICLKEFADPRMLPCIHTFCLECLKHTGESTNKKPEESMPCPLCRKAFVIPSEGMNGLQKNFFMESLIETLQLQLGNKQVLVCDMCKGLHEGNEVQTKEATMQCLECVENFCDMCSKAHKLHKLSNTHKIVKIGSEPDEVIKQMQPTRNCTVHNQHPLSLYCIDCRKILCTSCFDEKHASHKCQNVTTVQKEFRQTIERDTIKISSCIKDMLSKGIMVEERKTEILSNLAEAEAKIRQENLELKEMIDSHTSCLLEKLFQIKEKQMKNFACDKEEIERKCVILNSFQTYCTELIAKGSDSHVCSCVGELIARANELEKDHKAFIGRPLQITEVSFKNTELRKLLSHSSNNIMGRIEYTSCPFGLSDSALISFDGANSTFPGSASLAQVQSTSTVHEPDQRHSDKVVTNATDESKKEKTANEMLGALAESGQKISSSIQSDSRETPQNAFTTSHMRTKEGQDDKDRENCGIELSTALAKYKDMLQKLRDQVILIKPQRKDKKPSPLLKKEEVYKFRQQFDHIRHIPSDKWKTSEWNSIELCHENLIKLACTEAEGPPFAKILEHVKGKIEDILKNLDAVERNQKGIRSTGNNYYFNAVIQCLCQTFPLLEELSAKNISGQPLTEAFVAFWNHRCLGSPEQNKAFSKFFKELHTSSTKFNNFRQHDIRDLFIQFLNDLRSEERPSTAQSSRFNVQPTKVLTAVDKVFGGHFITMYACLNCDKPNFVCEYLLDITLPISIRKQQYNSGGGPGGAYQLPRQQVCTSTVDKSQDFMCSSYSDQSKERTRVFLEALNEDQHAPEDEDKGTFTRPVTLTECLKFYMAPECVPKGYHCLSCQGGNPAPGGASVQSMPPAMKRTLIYDPPAILVLHLKRFERTATGFTKRSLKITYEELLDLGPYCSSDCLRIDPEDKNVWYSLYGVVVHIGSFDSGHYIAYVKIGKSKSKATKTFLQKSFLECDEVATKQKRNLASGGKRADRKVEWQPIPANDDKWIYVSDTNTRDATSHEALTQEAFMLFYERVSKYGQ